MGETVFLDHVKRVIRFVDLVPKIIHHLIAMVYLPLTVNLLDLDGIGIEFDAVLAAHSASGGAVPNEEIIEDGIGTPHRTGAVHLVKLDDL
jgi:hypothetical protein